MKSNTTPSNDNETTTVLSSKPFELKSKTISSEQYNTFYYAEKESEGFDGFDKVMNILSPRIGECIIVYSELESTLESNIYELISDRGDQLGMMIARQMTYIQKVVLYIDLLRSTNTEDKDYRKDVSLLKKHLVKVAELRNIIASYRHFRGAF